MSGGRGGTRVCSQDGRLSRTDDDLIAAVRATLSQRLHAEVDRFVNDLGTDVVIALLTPQLTSSVHASPTRL